MNFVLSLLFVVLLLDVVAFGIYALILLVSEIIDEIGWWF